jgi:hypothetical protein
MYGPFRAGSPRDCFCGRPATEDFLGLARCAACASDDPVESPEQVSASARPVLDVLREAGVDLDASIYPQLLSREGYGPVLENSGVLALSRTETGTVGSMHGRVVISIVAGFPEALFRRLLAHELAHAFLLSRGVVHTPSWIEEGLAESFAHLYLGRPDATPAERLLDAELGPSSDRYHRVGFDTVRTAIDEHGLVTVLDAVRAGDAASVGLS